MDIVTHNQVTRVSRVQRETLRAASFGAGILRT